MKRFLSVLVVMSLLLALFQTVGMSATTKKYGGVLRTAVTSDPPTLDPA